MDTQRFDALTVSLARGGSRRSVLRGLAGGVLGVVALEQSGTLAQKDQAKPEQGGGRPITSPAKPICPARTNTSNCPTCYEARFGSDGPDGPIQGCCTAGGKEQDCKACEDENALYCSAESGLNDGNGTCVTVSCTKETNGKLRCDYKVQNAFCNEIYGEGSSCCPVFTSPNFGHCINKSAGETCEQV